MALPALRLPSLLQFLKEELEEKDAKQLNDDIAKFHKVPTAMK